MNKSGLIIASVLSLMLAGCADFSNEGAKALLGEARSALQNARYDEARLLIDTLRHNYPTDFDARREAVGLLDSVELFEAKDKRNVADSLEMEARVCEGLMKSEFVFEKQEKYQTRGYYVLPKYAGSKVSFSVFPEVEENGNALLVCIDSKRHYNFIELNNLSPDELNAIFAKYKLTETQKKDAHTCISFSKSINAHKNAIGEAEKWKTKVHFCERVIKEKRKP